MPGHKFVLASRGGIWTANSLETIQVLDLENLDSQVSLLMCSLCLVDFPVQRSRIFYSCKIVCIIKKKFYVY